jgi:Tol biopolymer transport system component
VEDLPYLDSGPRQSELEGAETIADVAAWSKLVFQSARDGNWEVYIADGDGSNQVRITHAGASDIHPSLNRGGTRIAYASNRLGNYEIYTRELSREYPFRRTFTSQNEYHPAWSPDGNRIAFQSYRDGQSEIYVMDYDGSNQTRLTWDAAYDGEPAWSPDGAQLAFTSKRTGGYRIWVMNADGSGKIQLSTQPYSEHPAWSPDGSQIAYDSDGYGDGWLDLWVMNADGSDAHSLVIGMSQTDCISPSWSPDGRYIAYTSVNWVMYGGNWYWRSARLMAWDSEGAGVTLSAGGRDWRPDWQAMEVQPPVTWMSPLTPYSRYWAVPVSWTGRDEGAGASGLRSFDVQSREGEGAWTDWLNNSEVMSAAFLGTSGLQAGFRVRARDMAYNVSNWTPDARVPETWLYAFELSGATRDARNVPLAGADISIDPDPVTPIVPDSEGTYRAYLSQPGATQVSVSAAGQGELPSSTWEMDHDRTVDFYLPPPDDVVQNGSFEAGGGSLAGWDSGGGFTPTVTSEAWHTGQAAVFLGDTPELELTPPESFWGASDIAVGQDGVVHAVLGSDAAYYGYRTVQGLWSTPVEVGSIGQFSYGILAAIAVAPQGVIHVVWNGEEGIYYSHSLTDASWSEPIVIASETLGASPPKQPDIASDGQGGIHVAYRAYTGITNWQAHYRYRSPEGEWTPSVLIADSGANYGPPAIIVGRGDTVHLVYGHDNGVWYLQRSPTGRWSRPELISADSSGSPSIAEDREGRLHALWRGDDRDGYYASRSPEGLWSDQVELPKFYGPGDLAVNSAGIVYAVYSSGAAADLGTYFAHKPAEGVWSEPMMIHGDKVERSVIVADQGDNLHVAYAAFPWHQYRTNVPSPVAAVSRVSQTLELSQDLHRPTLSWLYRLRGAMPGHSGGLTVRISQGMTTTEVFSTSQSVGWTHSWFDLEPWAGKTITLTLESRTAISEPYAQLTLDEISVGSWLTPVPLAVTPGHVDMGASATITITGENFLEGAQVRLDDSTVTDTHWVDGETLTAAVPAEMPPGIYGLWVVNPGGQEGLLRGGFQVGEVSFLPIVRRETP